MPADTQHRETRQVPAQALRMRVGPFALAAGESEAEAQANRFTMFARTADPISHWYWGRIVHDFAGMRHREQIAVDYCHDTREVIGFVDQFDVQKDGLHLAGELVPFTPDDRASEVLHKGKRKVPYEASIDFYSDELVLEWIPEGTYTQVNGRKFEGPGVVVREWPLRGVAVCPYGQDESAQTQFAADAADNVPVTLFSTDAAMPKLGKSTTKPSAASKLSNAAQPKKLAAAGETQPAEEQQPAADTGKTGEDADGDDDAEAEESDAGESGSSTTENSEAAGNSDPAALARQECQRFVKAFGAENGSKWFADGVSFHDAQDKHIAELQKQLAAKDKALAELQTKLSQVQLGETAPVSGGSGQQPADPQAAKLTQAVGDKLAKAAAAMKIPGRG